VADEDSEIDDTNANLRAWLRTGPNYDDDRPIDDVHEEEIVLEKLDDRWIDDLRQEKTTQEKSDELAANLEVVPRSRVSATALRIRLDRNWLARVVVGAAIGGGLAFLATLAVERLKHLERGHHAPHLPDHGLSSST
jgi:hypothetical protein